MYSCTISLKVELPRTKAETTTTYYAPCFISKDKIGQPHPCNDPADLLRARKKKPMIGAVTGTSDPQVESPTNLVRAMLYPEG